MNKKKTSEPQSGDLSQMTVDEAFCQAIDHCNAERYAEADKLCTAIIQALPNHIDAINLLGVIAQRVNRHDLAAELFQRAINIDKSPALLHYNLGISLYQLGRRKEAQQVLQTALKNDPGNRQIADYLNSIGNKPMPNARVSNLQSNAQEALQQGLSFHQSAQLGEAIHWYRKALEIQPENFAALNNLGLSLQAQGKSDEAVECYNKAISIKPDCAEAHFNLGNTRKDQGKLDEAVACYNKAIFFKPDYTEAYNNLGSTLRNQDKSDEAAACYQKAISIKPDCTIAHFNLGNIRKDQGKLDNAVASYQKAVSLDPQNGSYWAGFAQCVQTVNFSSCSEDLYHCLLQMLNQPTVRPGYISKSVISALRHHPQFIDALGLFKAGDNDKEIVKLAATLSTIPLLLRVMELSSIADLDVEKMLTQMRRSMLNEVIPGKNEVQGLPFYAAMAQYCFTNEYVFSESDEEKRKIAHLQEKINNLLKMGGNIPPTWIAVLGAYRPLHSFSWSDKLLESTWPDDIKKVIVRQVKEPGEEQALRSQFNSLTPIMDSVSQAVRSQYEENPYPRWVNTDLIENPKTIEKVLQEIKLNPDCNCRQFSQQPEVLVAGCGTGQHALSTATRFLNCNVLAVDLSLSSLSYALRKTQELGVSNIDYMQGDILELNHLERQFDIIECVGVLHHMDDPLAGWQTLTGILRTGGLMKIGLYSDIARQPIVEARTFIAQKKYTANPEDIRRLRQIIINMSADSDSGMKRVLELSDFFSLSECRDLLFHVQEHRFILQQIEVILQDLGLEFLGFELNNSRVMRKFRELYPEKDAQTSLSLWNQFEIQNPDTFLGMYEFWVQKV